MHKKCHSTQLLLFKKNFFFCSFRFQYALYILRINVSVCGFVNRYLNECQCNFYSRAAIFCVFLHSLHFHYAYSLCCCWRRRCRFFFSVNAFECINEYRQQLREHIIRGLVFQFGKSCVSSFFVCMFICAR